MQGVNRIPSPDGQAPPPGDYDTWDDYMADVEALEDSWDSGAARRRADYEANRELSIRISKAMELAPSIEVFESLMAGEDVPRSRLDQDWAKRYRL